jgi:hypothetical protein
MPAYQPSGTQATSIAQQNRKGRPASTSINTPMRVCLTAIARTKKSRPVVGGKHSVHLRPHSNYLVASRAPLVAQLIPGRHMLPNACSSTSSAVAQRTQQLGTRVEVCSIQQQGELGLGRRSWTRPTTHARGAAADDTHVAKGVAIIAWVLQLLRSCCSSGHALEMW